MRHNNHRRMAESKKSHIYRYQPFHRKDIKTNNIVDNLEIFSKKELFFVSPLNFNDPFDCKVFFTHEGCSDHDLFRFILYNTKRALTDSSDDEIENIAYQRLHKIISDKSELREAFVRYENEYIADIKGDKTTYKKGIGVLSLSENNDDILMWGHYADGHKGYCLEFNWAELEEWTKSIPCKLEKVIYSDSYPNIRDYMEYVEKGEGTSLDPLFLLRKSSHWAYEEECRIMVNIDWKRATPQIHCFPEHILTGVIFGCEMPDVHRKSIGNYLDSWHEKPHKYMAHKSESQYAVRIIE